MSRKNRKNRTQGSFNFRQFQRIPLGNLRCARYQRGLNTQEVDEIVENFDPHLVNPPKVSYRDGEFWVFDGQHTVEAHKRLFGDDYAIMCQVFQGMTYEDEAKLFAEQNGAARAVARLRRLFALSEGNEAGVRSFVNATENGCFKVNLEKQTRAKGYLPAVVTAWECFTKLGAEDYTKMLALIHRTWGGEPWSVGQNMLTGMMLFMKVYGETISEKRFISALEKFTEVDIKRACGALTAEPKLCYAFAIAKLYNKRGGSGTLNTNLVGLYDEKEDMA